RRHGGGWSTWSAQLSRGVSLPAAMRRARSRSGPGTGPRQDPEHEMAASKHWATASGRGRRVSRSPRTDDRRGPGDPATNTTRKYAAKQCRQTVPPNSAARKLLSRIFHLLEVFGAQLAESSGASVGCTEGAHQGGERK